MDDGIFLLYLIVNEDTMEIVDISDSVNKFISRKEAMYITK